MLTTHRRDTGSAGLTADFAGEASDRDGAWCDEGAPVDRFGGGPRPPRRSRRSGDGLRYLPGLPRGDEVPDDRVDVGLPAGPGEDAVVADALLQVMALQRLRDPGAQAVCRLGLPGRA